MAEPLDPRLVYAKTAAGLSEATHRAEALSPGARRMLILIDGRRSLAQLPGHARPGELPRLVEELLAAGLIALSGIVEELPPGWNDVRDPRLEDFKRRVRGAIERELGSAGRVLEARLQDCVNMTVMRSVMREVITLVRARAGEAPAERVAAIAQAAGRAWAEHGRGGPGGASGEAGRDTPRDGAPKAAAQGRHAAQAMPDARDARDPHDVRDARDLQDARNAPRVSRRREAAGPRPGAGARPDTAARPRPPAGRWERPGRPV
jgi:hypothetical protein